MRLKMMLFFVFTICFSSVYAASVDTIWVESKAMNKKIKVVVVTPERNTVSGNYPVIYLLHGYGGNARTWVSVKPELPEIADEKGLIFVCPDGENSWYWDSPQIAGSRFETFVGKELIDYVDRNYPAIADKNARAVTGLSMGGHGALWLAIKYKNTFGAAGSMSGGVDIRPFPKNWKIGELLGDYDTHPEIWESHTVITQLDRIENRELALIIDCGIDDFFMEVNRNLHAELAKRKIDHDFIVRPGRHNRDYWNNSIDYHILFFRKFFENTILRK